MTTSLYTPHTRALTVLFADLESFALQQVEAFIGTPGTLNERTNASGFPFYAHQYYDARGAQRETYLAGPVGDPNADAAADRLRDRIREVRDIVPSLRMLGREGFHLVDAKTYATVAALHNRGVFAAGAMLVGSHAFGVMLNRLGLRAAQYTTEDIDIAADTALAFEDRPEQGLLGILRESGIEFFAVPSLDRKQPPTSFKQRGRARFHVDLLAPARGESYPTVPVPELAAHATGLPYLGYLLVESQMSMVMTRTGCCAVRVPLPERFAVHKLIVSRLRTGREAKSDKDLHQACVLCAALAQSHPGAIETAVGAVPSRARKHFRRALASVQDRLERRAPRAWNELHS